MNGTAVVFVNGGELEKERASILEAELAVLRAKGFRVFVLDPLANTDRGQNVLASRLRDLGLDSYDEIRGLPGILGVDKVVTADA